MATSIIQVSDLMSYELEWASAMSDTCIDAASKMIQRNVGALPVKGADDQLIGIVTDRDIITRVLAVGLNPTATSITVAMTGTPLVTVRDTDSIEAAQRAMVLGDVRRLIVRSATSGEVVGLLSVDDLARAGLQRMVGEVIRETAMLHRDRQSIPSITIAGEKGASSQQETSYSVSEDQPGGKLSTGIVTPSSENTVSMAINRLFEWIEVSDSCKTAAIRMLHRNIGCLPVSEDGKPNSLLGIITDRDLLVRVVAANRNAETTRVRDVMSSNLAWCYLDDTIADAHHLMIERGVRRLPVLEKSTSKLVGILSVADIALWSSRSRAGAVIQSAVQNSSSAVTAN